MIKLKLTNVVQKAESLKAQVTICVDPYPTCGRKYCKSREYIINGLIGIMFEQISTYNYDESVDENEYEFEFYLKPRSLKSLSKDVTSSLIVTSKALGLKKQFPSDDKFLIHKWTSFSEDPTFDIEITISTGIPPSGLENTPELNESDKIFMSLYEDTDFTDFELVGDDGSVRVHKAVLAACSPVMKTMFVGEWAEKNGSAKISGVSKSTLEHLKMYCYLRKIPETGLKELLLQASCYIIPVLEHKCVQAIVKSMTAENTVELCEFAVLNRMTKLHIAILRRLQDGSPKILL